MDEDVESKCAELWMMVATMASDGNIVELGYDHDEGVAFCHVTDDVFEAPTLADAVRLAYDARHAN